MDIKNLQKNWDEFGKIDPLWSIATVDEKKDNKWDLKEFFDTGVKIIDRIMGEIKSNKYLSEYNKALDLGCGVGRLTNPLGNHFKEVFGLDIAPSMIELAEKYKTSENCKFLVNGEPNLKKFNDSSVNFVISHLTLQHMRREYAIEYLKEFSRVLKPGGIILFNLPSHFKSLRERVDELIYPQFLRTKLHFIKQSVFSFLHLKNPTEGPMMEMNYTNKKKVIKILEKLGIKLIRSILYVDGNFVSYEYLGIKEK